MASESIPEFISLRECARHYGISHETVRKWCVRYGVGYMDDGHFVIERDKFEELFRMKAALSQGAPTRVYTPV